MKRLVMAVILIGATAYAQDPVKVESVNGATTVGVDVLSKPSATLQFIRGNWGKLLIGAGTAIAVDRVADNNDWLWYEGKKAKAESTKLATSPASTSQSAGGNASQTTIIATDNSTINITISEASK